MFTIPKSGEAWFEKTANMYKLSLVKSNNAPVVPVINNADKLDNIKFFVYHDTHKFRLNKIGALSEEVKKYCEENLSKYSWPYEYEYRDSLPTTLVGKVAYKKLEEENK